MAMKMDIDMITGIEAIRMLRTYTDKDRNMAKTFDEYGLQYMQSGKRFFLYRKEVEEKAKELFPEEKPLKSSDTRPDQVELRLVRIELKLDMLLSALNKK